MVAGPAPVGPAPSVLGNLANLLAATDHATAWRARMHRVRKGARARTAYAALHPGDGTKPAGPVPHLIDERASTVMPEASVRQCRKRRHVFAMSV